MSDALADDLLTYLDTNRAFLAGTVEAAIASLDLASGVRVLDAGTGGGGALPPLARAVGPAGQVVALDRDDEVVALAAEHAAAQAVTDRVRFEVADMDTYLADHRDTFAAIWASDVLWPGNIARPAATVQLMADAIRPGGVVAVFTSNYYRTTFLPGHPQLERAIMTAAEHRWGQPTGGPDHHERHLAWLVAAGLEPVALSVLPRVGFPIDTDPAVRPYLEATVWPEMLASASHGHDLGLLDDEQLALAQRLLTPGTDGYLADQPGYHVVHPTLLATGRRPAR